MIASGTYTTNPGGTEVDNPLFYGVFILGVKRSGMGYRQVADNPLNMEFKWIPGRIIFDPSIPFIAGEKIWVLFQS